MHSCARACFAILGRFGSDTHITRTQFLVYRPPKEIGYLVPLHSVHFRLYSVVCGFVWLRTFVPRVLICLTITMGTLRLLLLAAAGGVGLAACVPAASVFCNGFPTGKAASVNSPSTQFRLDETESMQLACSPQEGQNLSSLALISGHVGRLDRSRSAPPYLLVSQ